MDKETSAKIRERFGLFAEPQDHDHHYVFIKPTLSEQECLDMFHEMTKEIFEKYPEKLENTSLIVHLSFPPEKRSVYPSDKVDSTEALAPTQESSGVKFDSTTKLPLTSGSLEECNFTFTTFNTNYKFLYFIHKDYAKFDAMLKEKLARDNIVAEHEWTFIYGTPGARMGKHVDFIAPSMRYSFAVSQPETNSSIRIDDVDYYMPTGSAYIIDGTLPHEVIQDGATPRLMLSGAVLI